MSLSPSWNMGANGYAQVNYGSDDTLNVIFHKQPTLNAAMSKAEGRPVYEALDYVRIQQPGERDYTDRPIDEVPEVCQRFAAKWQQYINNQKQVPDGTPLAILFPQNPEIAANLQSDQIGIHTIEQLANLSVEAMQRLGLGASDWVQKAKKFLDQASKGVGHHKLESELARRDAVIDDMTNKLNLAMSQINMLQQAQQAQGGGMMPTQSHVAQSFVPEDMQTPRRGRPPKTPV
jgi:hypothetical protein